LTEYEKQFGNPYMKELHKFFGEEVTVEYHKGDKVVKKTGIVKGFNFSHLSVVLMTDTEKILIKHVIEIRRKRSNKDDKSEKDN